MTVMELIEELAEYPPDMEVVRQMTVEFGVAEIEEVRLEKGHVVID